MKSVNEAKSRVRNYTRYKGRYVMTIKYWLMKSEPSTFGIDDLIKCKKKTDSWDGVRNYQARNFMRDDMQKGDLVFFYHSNTPDTGIVGVMEELVSAIPMQNAMDKTTTISILLVFISISSCLHQ